MVFLSGKQQAIKRLQWVKLAGLKSGIQLWVIGLLIVVFIDFCRFVLSCQECSSQMVSGDLVLQIWILRIYFTLIIIIVTLHHSQLIIYPL